MDLREMPTLTDLAKMLDSIGSISDGEHPETLHVLRWLIERSPTALEIYDRLHARRHNEPSLIELAQLIMAAETGESYPEAVYTVRWLIMRSMPASDLYRRLEWMADDAGFHARDPNWAVATLEVHKELDRLLATFDDWQDAAEAIELDMQKDYAFLYLLRVCRARIARSKGAERKRLEQLRRRLQDAARRANYARDPEAHLSELSSSLRSMVNPAATLETLEELLHRLRPLQEERRIRHG